jgi:predicted nucleotidyltransferase
MSSQDYHYYMDVLRRHLPELRQKYRVKTLGIFGSFVRGEQDEASDLDILVEFDDPPSLVKFVQLEEQLHQLTGIPVDLVMASALKPNIGKRVIAEMVQV